VSKCHFVHRKSYMDWSGNVTRTPGLRADRTAASHLSHGTVNFYCVIYLLDLSITIFL
jgi:hypothetical protein